MRLPATVLHERPDEVKLCEHLALLGEASLIKEALRLADVFRRANGGPKPGTRPFHVSQTLREMANRLCSKQGKLVILDDGEVFFGQDPIQ